MCRTKSPCREVMVSSKVLAFCTARHGNQCRVSAPNSLIYVTDCRPVTQLKLSLIVVVPSSPARHQQATERLFCLMMPRRAPHTQNKRTRRRPKHDWLYVLLRPCIFTALLAPPPDAICGPIKIIVSADRVRCFCFAWQRRQPRRKWMRAQLTRAILLRIWRLLF